MNRSTRDDRGERRGEPAKDGGSVMVTARRFWDGVSRSPTGPVEVLVQGRTITAVGNGLERPRGTSVIDLEDRTLLPGFIDCHVHTVDSPPETTISGQTLAALPALRSLLANGFTTVRDLGCADRSVTVDLRQAQRDGIVQGPAMIVAPHIISARGGHGDKSIAFAPRFDVEVGTLADGVEEILRAVRSEVRLGADWIKFAATGGFNFPQDDPERVTYTAEEMTALVAAARDLGMPSAAHAFNDEGVRRCVHAGVRTVEHAALAAPDTLALIAGRRDCWLVPTHMVTVGHLAHLDDDAFWTDKPAHVREKVRQHEDRLRRSISTPISDDIRVAFGSDSSVFPHEENWREFTAMVSTGMTPLRALRAATVEAAALLAVPDRGAVRPGLLADLVAMPGNPFDDIAATGEVDFVMQHGAVVSGPGQRGGAVARGQA
ncbi:amidohydrolase family protein [Catellatospora bangladeshensis]